MKNLTPLKAIRAHCRWCCLDRVNEIRLCQSQESCPLWAYRFGKMPGIPGQSALKAIRGRCLDCIGGSPKDVANCKTPCAINQYRFGKRINVSEAYREQARARLKNNPLFKKTSSDKPIQTSNAVG